MKVLPAALAAHYASGSTTLAHGLRIERKDGDVFAFTSADHDALIDGVLYLAAPGLEISSIAATAGFGVDNLELTVFPDPVLLTREGFIAGLWRGARYELFAYNWADLGMGINVLKRGWIGETKLGDIAVTVELRSLRQALQQEVGEYTSQTCRNRLGDARCKVDLAPLTSVRAVLSSADRYTVTLDGPAAPNDYYGEGTLAFLDGANAGVQLKVRSHQSGVLTLATPAPFPIAAGTEVRVVAGCRKRLQDCRDRYANVLNMRAEPHIPGIDALTAYPSPGSK